MTSISCVIIPCPEEGIGNFRIQMSGQSVDLVAKATGLRIERDDAVELKILDKNRNYWKAWRVGREN